MCDPYMRMRLEDDIHLLKNPFWLIGPRMSQIASHFRESVNPIMQEIYTNMRRWMCWSFRADGVEMC